MVSIFRQRLGVGLLVIIITAVAVLGAFYLGRLYIDIVREGSYSGSKRVISNKSKSVVAQDEGKILLLNPVPVYFLQAGVYSDMKGAQDAAKPLSSLGYRLYITQSAPHKIWIGIYKNRSDTETVKRKLMEKGYGSFTGAVVVNGENLRYRKGNEALVKQIAPVLETYTLWLRENLELFHAGSIDRLNNEVFLKQTTVVDTVYKAFDANSQIRTNSENVNRRFGSIEVTVRGYKQELEAFKKQKTADRYSLLQSQLLRFIDNYLLLLQEIDNLSQT